MAVAPLESTSSLPTFTLPAYSVATTSIVGAICRQGPHHAAQKSTSTGSSLRRTSWSKPASVKVNVSLPAISSPNPLESAARGKDSMPQQPPVQPGIRDRRTLPGEVLLHSAAHHGLPGVRDGKRLDRAPDSVRQGQSGVLRELKPRVLIDGIIQPSGGANHRHRAIPQAVDLVEPARLIAAGHEEHVGSRF